MYSALDISRYFLHLADPDCGEGITNLKLQKLCYYAQGFYLAINNKPLFSESIEAWQHGPVVPVLYHEYKKHGNMNIDPPEMDFNIYPKEIRDFLSEVYDTYGQFSAWKLRDLTHNEIPWIEASKTISALISHESMKNYFKTLITV